jgi:hypothetical protein
VSAQSPTEPEGQLLAYRVGQLEQKVDGLGRQVGERFDQIAGQLSGLTVLAQMEKRLDARIDQVERDVSKNWAAFVALLVLLLGAIITVLTRLGGVFG